MGLDVTVRRRLFGALMLLVALGMLIVGETLLKGRLQSLGFLIYWLLCLVFTGMAILVAYVDVLALQRKTKREARELLETTLGKIETDVKAKPDRLRLRDDN
jgi:membrane protein implicated in regulation of membrane protease activity